MSTEPVDPSPEQNPAPSETNAAQPESATPSETAAPTTSDATAGNTPTRQRRRRQKNPTIPPDQEPEPLSWNPIKLLAQITKRYPFTRYVWVGVVLLLLVRIAIWLGLDVRLALGIMCAGLFLLINFFLFGRIATLTKKETSGIAKIQLYFGVSLFDIIATGLGIGILCGMFFGRPIDLRHWLTGPTVSNRVDHTDATIPVRTAFSATPGDGLYSPNIPDSASPEDKITYSMNKWKEWIHQGAGPKDEKQQLLIVKSRKPFDKDYNTFSVTASFNNDAVVELVEGSAFMVSSPASNDGHPIYRQLPMKIEKHSLDNRNTLEIVAANKEESVFLILKVRAREGHELPKKPEGYDIQLRKR